MKKDKMEKTMGEFKRGKLHSGSKSGPKVKSRKQAVAIGLSKARRAGVDLPMPPGKRGTKAKPAKRASAARKAARTRAAHHR